ncbi:MAG TPA: hypothetical protein VHO25_17935 [Polyangiaceae bacterium]|nr:hypothetical protein [Polyangiaceae bacterium]
MRHLTSVVITMATLSCSRPAAPGAESTTLSASSARSASQSLAERSAVVFSGTCDASGAVPLSSDRFAVADDEDNVLRVYDANRGGPPLWQTDLSPELDLPIKEAKPGKKAKKAPETDIEAATRIEDIALWLTSHGRNSSGKEKPERLRLFATTAPVEQANLQLVGQAQAHLLDAVLADPRYSTFGLSAAAERAPKDPEGLNIEGMTARTEGGVWIGFRNPRPDGKALLLLLINPLAMVRENAAPILGDPRLLDLGTLGIRSLSYWRGRYLIVAGHYSSGVASRVFSWDGKSDRVIPLAESPEDLNPEGFFTPEERDQIMLLSDDGARVIEGIECKKHKDISKKSFRGVWWTP